MSGTDHVGTAAPGCAAEQRSARFGFRQKAVELRSTGQPEAAVPTRFVVAPHEQDDRAHINLSVLHSDSFFQITFFVSKGHRDEASATGFTSLGSLRIIFLPNNLWRASGAYYAPSHYRGRLLSGARSR